MSSHSSSSVASFAGTFSKSDRDNKHASPILLPAPVDVYISNGAAMPASLQELEGDRERRGVVGSNDQPSTNESHVSKPGTESTVEKPTFANLHECSNLNAKLHISRRVIRRYHKHQKELKNEVISWKHEAQYNAAIAR